MAPCPTRRSLRKQKQCSNAITKFVCPNLVLRLRSSPTLSFDQNSTSQALWRRTIPIQQRSKSAVRPAVIPNGRICLRRFLAAAIPSIGFIQLILTAPVFPTLSGPRNDPVSRLECVTESGVERLVDGCYRRVRMGPKLGRSLSTPSPAGTGHRTRGDAEFLVARHADVRALQEQPNRQAPSAQRSGVTGESESHFVI
jgi:hypothetical protein